MISKFQSNTDDLYSIMWICAGTVTKGLVQRLDDLGNKRTSGDHPNNSIIKIGQCTEKSPSNLRRLAVTQTPVNNNLITLV